MEDNDPIDKVLMELEKELRIFRRDELRSQLICYVNELLLHQFDTLVSLLYRVDVSEEKLKALLKENPGTDAAEIITDLIISRQMEKRKLRGSFPPDHNIAEEDKG